MLHPVSHWTLILVGFRSGRVQFFADNGTLLLERRFLDKDSPLVRVRVSTRGFYKSLHSGPTATSREPVADQSARVEANANANANSSCAAEEQVLLLFACGAIAVIDAFDLLQTARALRSRKARQLTSMDAAADADAGPDADANALVRPSHRRYLVDEYDDAHDFAIGASCVRQSRFEQLCAASLVGAGEHISAAPPALSLYLLCGGGGGDAHSHSPCFGSLAVRREADADSLQHPLVEYSHAIGRSLKAALSSRFGIWRASGSANSKTTDSSRAAAPPPPQPVRSTRVQLRFGFADNHREGVRLCVPFSDEYSEQCSPHAALVDNLSRVLLLEARSGLVVRVFKGYRDCQAGWLFVREHRTTCGLNESDDDDVDDDDDRSPAPLSNHSHSHSDECGAHTGASDASRVGRRDRRAAQCLVLYAPKRSLLEVWLGAQGPRVAAFNVSSDGALLSTEHGCLGLGYLYLPAASPNPSNGYGYGYCNDGGNESDKRHECSSLLTSSTTFYMVCVCVCVCLSVCCFVYSTLFVFCCIIVYGRIHTIRFSRICIRCVPRNIHIQ